MRRVDGLHLEVPVTDQGSRFTSREFVTAAQCRGIALNIDGKGCWRDKVFAERVWHSLKYEEVYLPAYDAVGEERARIERYVAFYNQRRPNGSLARRTPDAVYFNRLPLPAAA